MAYTVKAVAKMLGVSPNTLRSWEIRHHAVEPDRTGSNRRTYGPSQVERLRLLCTLLNEGHSIGAIAGLTDAKLKAMLPRKSLETSSDSVDPILEALTDFNFGKLAELLDLNRVSHSTRDYVLKVISPLLGRVGHLVANGKLSIAHEHALSALIRDQIGQTLQSLRRDGQRKQSKTFLFATPEGDLHEFGILLAASLCANYGYRAHYLGANLPAEALAIAVKALKPDCVVLGNSPRGQTPGKRLEDYLRELGKALPAKTEIWIGGQGEIPHLRAIFGKRKYEVLKSLSQLDTILNQGATE